ncbi:multicopper oxidase domain-containing protein [Geobacter sp. SVR]|uniref:multicopper oxidase domain-containing protein n=1 Tax=Geobacter sp. SVR TaxID=2495594 RepID=UPI00143EFD5E|nr:multicopper oxidase domain-containing protein [Geobacter sp. SVR]BCS54376.1 multicopper oxidase [Geobacter sp. SVR]GCF87455.1 multicopper oxidase [Geobacter sp. SVR]
MHDGTGFKRRAVALGAGLVLLTQGHMTVVSAAPVPGGTLDPTTIPKFATPLVIPPVMPKSTVQPGNPAADYNIAVRQFRQQILPSGFPSTTVWSYGRAQDVLPANFVAPAPLSSGISFNYPAFTVENTSGSQTKVRWINDLKDASGNFLPHLLTVDQTLHWANPPATGCADGGNHTDCMTMNPAPYTGPVPLVTHVHGSHVNPQSDGYPEAWWLPAANNIPAGYAKRGSKFDQFDNTNTVPGSAYYGYENNQPAATLWYHDHALGMTRNNVYAGPAGFWLIRGGINGDGHVRDNQGNMAYLPGPAPKTAGGDPNFTPSVRAKIREIPLAIQDRSFNADGSLFYPGNRAFFEELNVPAQPEQFPGAGVLDIPFVPGSDIAPIWNPEAFFNTMVVNGNTWPQLEVAPALYRLRLLDGCNSRTLNLALFQVLNPGTANETLGAELPFFQIGAEQGFLPKVAMIQTGFAAQLPGNGTLPTVTPDPANPRALLMGPAERADVIVDFRNLPTGTVVRMINTAPDAPFGGFPDDPSDPGTTGQVMQFVVNSTLTQATDATATPPQNLVLPAEGQLGATTNTRQLTLNELESNQVCVQEVNGSLVAIPNVPFTPDDPSVFLNACATAGGFPMGPKAALLGVLTQDAGNNPISIPKLWAEPVTEAPLLNAVEEWQIFNTTVDAHPIHLHLVRFLVLDRQDFDPVTFAPLGSPTPVNPNEEGYKDTVVAMPGQITRIKAKFDIPGEYVWHCHIVEHEDNEMMRPYIVRFDPNFPDFNQDGKVDNADYAILLAEIRKTTLRNPAFDLNRDGKVDLLDARFFYTIMQGI